MACTDVVCGTGGWTGPLPGDPDNNSILTATPAFGGIDVSWTYPEINAHAVAYTILYRGILPDFLGALRHSTVAGNFFYDKTTSELPIQYYYWIQIVSVNGTVGELIGPASATARPTIEQTIELLTGKIDRGVLAQSLKVDIDNITTLGQDLITEIQNRILSNNILGETVAGVQAQASQAITYILEEANQRTTADDALVTSIDLLAAGIQGNAAALIEEKTIRVTKDDALTQSVTQLYAASASNTAAIQSEATTRTNADTALASNVTLLFAQSSDRAAAINSESSARISADAALASQITTAQSTLGDSIASVQTSLQTNINTVGGKVTDIGALYTAKVSVDGLIGGFGVYNDGTEVEAGFDVDRFWVGRTGATGRKPFIIEGTEVFIDKAAINKLTFSSIRNESGSIIGTAEGKLKAQFIETEGLSIKDTEGNIVLTSGDGKFSGALKAATGTFSGQLSAATGSFTGSLLAATGTFSGVLSADAINAVSTINIAGEAVTVPRFAGSLSQVAFTTDHVNLLTTPAMTVPTGSVIVSVNLLTRSAYDFDNYLAAYFYITRNGVVIWGPTASEGINWVNVASSIADTPNGNAVYKLWAYGTSVGHYAAVKNMSLSAIGCKK